MAKVSLEGQVQRQKASLEANLQMAKAKVQMAKASMEEKVALHLLRAFMEDSLVQERWMECRPPCSTEDRKGSMAHLTVRFQQMMSTWVTIGTTHGYLIQHVGLMIES